VLARARRTRQSARLHQHRQESRASDQLVFGPSLANVKAQMEKIVAADLRMQSSLPPVLIQGETGTGKTSFARWLHEHGPRSTHEMVEINCSALPESLAESELFGHEKGAFTDAKSGRIGLFEAASGGTLFLDELPSLSLPLQAKVLTAIEDRSIRRVGGNRGLQIDVRIIAATNRDLKSLIEEGDFREDLFHRLDLYRVSIPPLRERGHEILDLAEQLKNRLCRQHRLPRKSIAKEGQERLLAQPWPGNVRELAHELERAIVFEEGQELLFPQLASRSEHHTSQSEGVDWLNEAALFEDFSLEKAIDRLVDLAMRRTNNNVSAAARLLHMPRDFVRYRLRNRRK
jgi:DNA-binding NtrC family response regulator